MRLTKLTTEAALESLVRDVYPGVPGAGVGQFSARVKTKIKTFVRLYEEEKNAPTPTWNIELGRRGGL